jgi:hypothetical protein
VTGLGERFVARLPDLPHFDAVLAPLVVAPKYHGTSPDPYAYRRRFARGQTYLAADLLNIRQVFLACSKKTGAD